MLLRIYRLTDKVGLVVLKLSGAIGDFLLQGAAGLTGVFGGIFGWIISGVLLLLSFITMIVSTFLSGLVRLLRLIFSMLGIGVQRGITTGNSAIRDTTSRTMARRAARAEVDVVIAEDPLRIENRRLSYLVTALGMVVVVAVIYATSDRSATTPVANPGNASAALLLAETPQSTDVALVSAPVIASPIPTATQIPDVLRVRGTVAYSVRENSQSDLWAVDVLTRNAVRITNDIADERDPAWNAAGTQLAYASRQDGNWELYVYDLATQASSRVTFDLAFQGNPTWSPDGAFLAYESYLSQDPAQPPNLDIYALPIDGSTAPFVITDHPAADFAPTWSPSGRQIAFVSWREGNQDIYVFDLDTFTTVNLTNTPLRNEDHPAWSPDGRFVAYSAVEQGTSRVFVKPASDPSGAVNVIGLGRMPSWSPDGASLVFAVDAIDGSQTYLQAVPYGREGGVPVDVGAVLMGANSPSWSERSLPPNLLASGGLPLANTEPLFVEQAAEQDTPPIYRLNSLGDVQTEQPYLSDAVNDSFAALRERVIEVSGVDFLAQLDDAFWLLERPTEPGEERRNWHMTGRAFSILRNSFQGFPAPIEIVREDDALNNTRWRIYLRVSDEQQSGQLGEPLRAMPWDFLSIESGDVEAYNQGGRLKRQMPVGYYIDLTQLAADYGWERIAAASNWRSNVRGRNYWMFINDGGLSWYDAMLQIHTEGELVNFAPRETGS